MITYFFRTYGCQANVADSNGLARFLNDLECQETTSEALADLIIVNTCAVRDKAEQKLFSYLGTLKPLKLAKPHLKLGVIGCVASYKKQELYDRFDHISFVYGAREDMKTLETYLADLVTTLETKKQIYGAGDGSIQPTKNHDEQDRDVKKLVQSKGLFNATKFTSGLLKKRTPAQQIIHTTEKIMQRSFINIMTGCNKCCAYCIVPMTRGKETSYPIQQLVDTVIHDVANGAKEVNLVGQNVNSYRDPVSGENFSALLRHIAALPGEFWVRWISPHPQDMTPELFDVIAQHQHRIPPYVHFPVQSGSNTILEAMRRNYTIEYYLEQIGWLRDRMPHATISTDIIVGFPGETDEDFQATMRAVETIQYDWIYSFIYSPRKYTRAATMPDDCPSDIKQARLEVLQKRQIAIADERYKRYVGKTLKTLVEKRLAHGKLLARTEGNVRVLIDGSDSLIGTFVDVMITESGPVNLIACTLERLAVHALAA